MQHEMIMVAHQAIGEHLATKARQGLCNDIQMNESILVINKDRLEPVATRGDVIDSAGEFDTKRTGHAGRLRWREAKDKA